VDAPTPAPTAAELRALVAQLQQQLLQMQGQLTQVLVENAALQAENQRLRQELERFTGPPPPPAWVKASTPKLPGDPRPRKKRARSFVRRQEPAAHVTRRVRQQAQQCPDCGRPLSGGWVHRRRQVLGVPETPLEVVEHEIVARECGVCRKWVLPKVTAQGLGVSGKRRLGVRLQSLTATYHIVGRLPLKTIQVLLKSRAAGCPRQPFTNRRPARPHPYAAGAGDRSRPTKQAR
jgi:ribosomal protein L34E